MGSSEISYGALGRIYYLEYLVVLSSCSHLSRNLARVVPVQSRRAFVARNESSLYTLRHNSIAYFTTREAGDVESVPPCGGIKTTRGLTCKEDNATSFATRVTLETYRKSRRSADRRKIQNVPRRSRDALTAPAH